MGLALRTRSFKRQNTQELEKPDDLSFPKAEGEYFQTDTIMTKVSVCNNDFENTFRDRGALALSSSADIINRPRVSEGK